MKTRYLTVSPEQFELDKLKDAVRVLENGGLVVFPTETIYGLAARADNPETISRLRLLKGRSDDKPFTVHVGDVDDIFDHVRVVPPLAMRVIEHYWPGPVTLILNRADGGEVGLRWPEHPIAQDLLRLCHFPVVAPSVNPEGMDPSNTVDMVKQYFNGKIDLVLDAGEVRFNQSSTILQVTNDSWEILREGPITREQVEDLDYKKIVFVCTGNTCRSPMAEGIAKHLLAKKYNCEIEDLPAKGFHIHSAGTSSFGGSRASGEAIIAMKEIGIDIRSHVSHGLSMNLIDTADNIYSMTGTHLYTIRHWNPFVSQRAQLLSAAEKNVSDPFGGRLEDYQKCAEEIYAEVERIVEGL